MHVQDIFAKRTPTFSFEFFPPKTEESSQALYETISELESHKPDFVSVTYGAGGSTRELTNDLVVRIKNSTSLDPVPHLTCVCHCESDIESILARYAEEGVNNILALGGDPPRNLENYKKADDAFQQAADLVRFIKKFSEAGKHPDARGFGIGVAGFPEGHPATPNRLKEMDYLKAKVDEGADYIVTQLFFSNDDFHDFRDRCELAGIQIPIIAGIMPVTSTKGMERMADLAAGARFPAKLLRILLGANDAETVEKVGIDYATEQCSDLLENQVSGIHFYTLNKSHATREIYASLGISPSPSVNV
ncbi:MAG: methylenetetrahydrofolate reductase [NAD(P)H] [Verrucomicrobiales bacterium]|nr:methylenetetrahydrofolate reductase [NAD(P)H] [Verrucomicrobiales bacterium]